MMRLNINSYGASIRKEGECFFISSEDKKDKISAKKIEQIVITTGATITTDAIKLAMENNIDIVFLEATGQPFGRVWHSKLGSITTIRRKQLTLTTNQYGLGLVKEWVGQKMEDQMSHLTKLMYNRSEEKKTCIQEAVEQIQKFYEAFEAVEGENIEEVRMTLEGYEGNAGKIYFKTLSKLIPSQYTFSGRSRNPAKDYFNCMLNYAYGILYSNVEKCCIIAGLDPYIGVMHTDNYNKKALVFDLVELYRGYMNEVVFKLFSTKQVKQDMFNQVPNGFYLNAAGKELLIGAVQDGFAKKIQYKGRQIEIENIIAYDCHSLANRILKEVE